MTFYFNSIFDSWQRFLVHLKSGLSLKPPGRGILVVAIFALLGIMAGGIYYASLDNPSLEMATVELENVQLIDVNSIENTAKLKVTFFVTNPSDLTFTIPLITFDLYADGVFLGIGSYSTEDIAMPGRAAFYSGAEIPLDTYMTLVQSVDNKSIYDSIVTGKSVEYTANGVITVESAWSIVEKEFWS